MQKKGPALEAAAPHRLDLKVSDVLVAAFGAPLCKAVAVQLCQLLPWDSRPKVQPVHILAHHICQLACLQQAHQCLQPYGAASQNQGAPEGALVPLSTAQKVCTWCVKEGFAAANVTFGLGRGCPALWSVQTPLGPLQGDVHERRQCSALAWGRWTSQPT